ncbi:KAP family NTPase [Micromonospora sp. R77]|uniref:KAP family P-loop NTPase fold protein n=1 Tax=Micromonospora sp. R77 TaxID=2925836 RepID=UPI001F62133E|nr:P-loop NTPase fold protein [Micromonospora sp. R77]MCI4065125.1 KAP family NTPase [Micromonospora sp. R77]
MTSLAVLSDAPALCGQDRLQFSRYVDPLVSLLASPDSHTPFTIGVLGAWGSGKSSVLTMVDERLRERNEDAFLPVHFNPWVHRREPNLIQPLLRALRDAMTADRAKRFQSAALKITSIIGTLAADTLLSAVTAGRVTVDKLDAASAQYAKARNDVGSELSNLRTVLRDELAGLDNQGIRAVIFIDDLDRCEPDQVIDLLESIKLFLDVPGVFVLMALSKELVDRAVAMKYRDFGFAQEDLVDLGDEYLEKMIQLPLYLLPLDNRGVRTLLSELADPQLFDEHGDLLEKILLPNPRKIKRVLNLLAFTTSMVARTPGLAGLNRDLLVRLTTLRVQTPRLFSAVLADPDILVILELIYAGKLEASEGALRTHFRERGPGLYRAIEPHYRRQAYLEPLFTTSDFGSEQARLADHLTLFGGQP